MTGRLRAAPGTARRAAPTPAPGHPLALAPQVGADLARTLRRRTAPAVLATLLAVMGAAALLLHGLAVRQDRAAVEASTRLVDALVRDRLQLMRRVVIDYAGWEEAYLNLHTRLSVDWAYGRDQLGLALRDTFGFDLVLVVRPDSGVGYAFGDGALLAGDPRPRLQGGLAAMVDAARVATPFAATRPVPAVGFLRLDGAPAIAGAAAVIPPLGATVARDPGTPTVLVFVDRLSPDELARRGDRDLIDGLRFAGAGPLPPGAPGLPLVARDGSPAGLLTWSQELPGTQTRRALLPWLLGVALATLALTARALRQAQRAARALAASETRFRDVAEAASDWIWETDARQELVFLSERFAAMTGFPVADALGRKLTRYLELESPVGASRTLSELLAARAEAGAVGGSFLGCYRTRDAARRICRVSVRPVRDPARAGALIGHRGMVSDVTPEVEAQREARRLSLHDPLTGLPNRMLLIDRLGQAVRHARRHGGRIAVLCLDLDRFKPVNDAHGHAAGDTVLRETARRLRSLLRDADTVARVGGDEFVAVVHDRGGDGLEIETLCHRLLHAVGEPIELAGGAAEVGLSIGVARCPDDGDDLDHLLTHADLALYEAKQAGRGTYRFFSAALSQRLLVRRALERELRRGVEAGEFELEFQPRFRLADMRPVAAEALLRWHHPARGRVPPGEFVPLAEETGLIVPIGGWALREACRRAAALRGLAVSVNVSPIEFKRGSLVAHVEGILRDTGLHPTRLELEITETTLFQEAVDPLPTMRALKAMGVRLAMDDFGTGYSSLNYLRRFPFDRIKIDRGFIADLEDNPGTRAIVRAVIGLGRALGLGVTAEGVETSGQLRILRAEGCDEVQGFYIGRPVAWDEIERALLAAAA